MVQFVPMSLNQSLSCDCNIRYSTELVVHINYVTQKASLLENLLQRVLVHPDLNSELKVLVAVDTLENYIKLLQLQGV